LKIFGKQCGKGKTGEEISDAQAQKLLAELRTELPGIRRWLEEGKALRRR
jgi:hypothetical protein